MAKELVIIYDGPAGLISNIVSHHNLAYFKKYFNKIRIIYWAKKEESIDSDFVLYPYLNPYNSRYLTGLKYMFWIFKTLKNICKENKDFVFMTVIPIWSGLPTLIAGKLYGKKVVLRLEAEKVKYLEIEAKIEKKPYFLKTLVVKIIYFLTMPFYDYVVALSEGVLKEAEHYGAKRIMKIPILINLEPFLSIKSKGDKTILYAGQMKEIKGISELIEATKMLEKEGVNFNLLIAGGVTNPKDEVFFNKVKDKCLGFISHTDMKGVYEKADIFVLPSYTEALPMVVMEAMASGLPVVVTSTSGGMELVEDGKTGFLIPIKDAKVLKEKLKILLSNPSLCTKMGEAGRERIKEMMVKADQSYQELWQKIK